MSLKRYRKAIVAAAGVIIVVGKALSDGTVSPDEAGAIVLSVGVALGVWAAPNEPAA